MIRECHTHIATYSVSKYPDSIALAHFLRTFELSLNGSVKLEGGGSLKEFGLVNGDLVFVIDWDQKERETSDSKRDETREQPSCNVVGIRCVSEVNGTSPTSPGHRSPESTTADQGSEAVAMETSLDCHRGTLSAALSSRNNFEKLLSSAVELMEKSCEPLDVLCLAVDALMLDSGFVSCEVCAVGGRGRDGQGEGGHRVGGGKVWVRKCKWPKGQRMRIKICSLLRKLGVRLNIRV